MDVERFLKQQAIEFTKRINLSLILYLKMKMLLWWDILQSHSINIKNFSNKIKRKIARVSELNEMDGTYTLSAYLIAQLGKNFSDQTSAKITGKQLLQAAIDTIKELRYMAEEMVVFFRS